MTAPVSDTSALFDNPRALFGIGLIAALALGLTVLQMSVTDEAPKPPMPTTKIEVTEAPLIDPNPVNFEASLNLNSTQPAFATTKDE